ncbi:MAG: PD40 domain-containing protein, partial [Acidobacteria bacterium]|nr:PD40 domain-containing protein [Acidobacteriota bacterium]
MNRANRNFVLVLTATTLITTAAFFLMKIQPVAEAAPKGRPSSPSAINYGGIIFGYGVHPAAAFYKVNPDGTNRIALNDVGSISVRSPSVSPATGMIAFSNVFSVGYHSEDLYVMNWDGSGIRRLTSPPDFVRDFNPRISPDGTKIAFISNRNAGNLVHKCNAPNTGSVIESNEVFVMNIDGSGLTQVTQPWYFDNTSESCGLTNCSCFGGDNFQVEWMSDSQRLAVMGDRFYQRMSGDARVGSTHTIEIVGGSGPLMSLYGDDPNNDPVNRDLPPGDPSKRVVFPIHSDVRGGMFDVAPDDRILFPTAFGGTGFAEFADENQNSVGIWTPGTLSVSGTATQTLMGQMGYAGTTDGRPHGGDITEAQFSPDGQHIVIQGHSPRAVNNANTLFVDSGAGAIPGLENFVNISGGLAWAPGPTIPRPDHMSIDPNPVVSFDGIRTPVTPSLFDAAGNVIARTAQFTNGAYCPTCGLRCDNTPDQIGCTGLGGRDATIDVTGAVIGSANEGSDNLCEENAGIRTCVPHYNTAGSGVLSVSATRATALTSGTGGPGVITIKREGSNPPLGALIVNFDLAGDALRDLDYALDITGNTITLPAGQMSVEVNIRPLRYEPFDRNVTLTLLPGQNGIYTVAGFSPAATVAIRNDLVPPVCSSPPSGIAGWWSGDDSTADVLGANNGIAEGNLGFQNGMVGRAFALDGTSADVRVPTISGFNTSQGLTIDTWIKPTDVSALHAIAEWNTGTSMGAHFYIGNPLSGNGDGALLLNLVDNSGNGHVVYTGAGKIMPNKFQHVAATYDRSDGVHGYTRIYVNGSAVPLNNSANTTIDLGVFTPATNMDLYLGERPSGPNYRFSGLIDEIEIFNRG